MSPDHVIVFFTLVVFSSGGLSVLEQCCPKDPVENQMKKSNFESIFRKQLQYGSRPDIFSSTDRTTLPLAWHQPQKAIGLIGELPRPQERRMILKIELAQRSRPSVQINSAQWPQNNEKWHWPACFNLIAHSWSITIWRDTHRHSRSHGVMECRNEESSRVISLQWINNMDFLKNVKVLHGLRQFESNCLHACFPSPYFATASHSTALAGIVGTCDFRESLGEPLSAQSNCQQSKFSGTNLNSLPAILAYPASHEGELLQAQQSNTCNIVELNHDISSQQLQHSGFLSDIFSDILSGILSDIYSNILSNIYSDNSVWLRYTLMYLITFYSGILSEIYSGMLYLTYILTCPLRSWAGGWGGHESFISEEATQQVLHLQL